MNPVLRSTTAGGVSHSCPSPLGRYEVFFPPGGILTSFPRSVGNLQVLTAQGVAAMARFRGAESAPSGANYFSRRKALRQKELRCKARKRNSRLMLTTV